MKYRRLLRLGLWGLFLVILISTFVIVAQAQSVPIQFAVEENHLDDMEGTADSTHIAVWGKVDAELTRFVLVNRATQHVSTYRVSSTRFRFAGMISTDDDIKFYIETKLPQGDPRIELLTFVKKGEYFQQKVLDRENYIASFAQDGIFYRIAIDKKKNLLKVVATSGLDADRVMTFPITNDKVEKIIRKERFEFVPQMQAISYKKGRTPNKIYVRGGIVYLISDGSDERTTEALVVMSLDMTSGKAALRTIPWLNGDKQEIRSGSALAPPPGQGSFITTLVNAAQTKHNSFLLGNRLFVFCFDNEKMALSIHDIKTGEQVKLLQYAKGTPVGFKASDLMTNDKSLESDWSDSKTPEARATKILKSLNKNGQPLIMAEPTGPNIRLIAGSKVYSTYSGGTLMYPGSTTTPSGGTMRLVNPAAAYVEIDYNYFYGYLTTDNLEPSSTAYPNENGPVDALNKRFDTVSKEIKTGESGIVYDGPGVLLAYINKKTRQMVIEKISAN